MIDQSIDRTSATLLRNAGLGDSVAWVKLDKLYRPMLLQWARARGASENEADEAASEVLVALVGFLGRFKYDAHRSFRAYLSTMLRNELIRASKKRLPTHDESRLQAILVDESSLSNLVDQLIAEEEKMKVPAILLLARQRVQTSTWLSWEMTTLRGLAGKEVADQLDIPVANVYVNRQRVNKLLSEIGKELESGDHD